MPVLRKLATGPVRPGARQAFLIDGLGGLLTATMLGLVLPAFHQHIGLPAGTLRLLGLAGLGYATYSLSCFRFLQGNPAPYLRFIVVANLLYCLVTAAILATHRNTVTTLGLSYFVAEVLVILAVVSLEIRILRRLTEAG